MTQNDKTSRREFLANLGIIGAFILAIGAFFRGIFLFAFPEQKKKSFHKFLVAKKDDIPLGAAKEVIIGKEPVFVVHLKSGYRVFSGVCTHLGCIIRWEAGKNRFYCPCHKGTFDRTGQVTGGPPPRPLDEYRVETDDRLVFIHVQDKRRSPWT